jgi:phage baseplate assembly protein W
MSNTEYAITLPFTLGFTGSVETTTDQRKIWADKVLSVIGTAIGERVQRYYFGSKVHYEVFDTAAAAPERLEGIISEAFGNYLPLLTFSGLSTTYSQDTGTLTVTVTYYLPDDTEESTKVGVVQITGNQPAEEF